ncbi:MAG: NusG domain II-containing protein [Thermoanaerobacteraceae bacterium]|nr:NusG domain II-containing protein [Thermoanaerobacteraceae bacterium]
MKIGDRILIAAVIIFSVAGFAYSILRPAMQGDTVYIEVDGKLYEALPLDQDKTVTVHVDGDGYNVVEIKDGRVRISDANCPDRLCVRQGWINEAGENIICLPHRVVVRIPGRMKNVDQVTY